MDPPECTGHAHDHDHEDGLGLSLRQYIDFPKVFCLNEEVSGSGAAILKLHEERLIPTPSLQSPEGDPELILYIPFTEAVTIQSITIHCAPATTSATAVTAPPRRIKLFVDRNDLDFETARELPPSQELELLPPHHIADGTIDYPVRPAGRFQNISSLTIFVVDNYDTDANDDSGTEITHVGIKGKGTKIKRGVVNTVYETQGMPKDHSVRGGGFGAPSVL
jgi:PITH domain